MKGYAQETYGERIADLYDLWPPGVLVTEACVDQLVHLAGKGPVLELGVGTGRLAIPLAERGLQVDGIDASPSMHARLVAEKPGGSAVRPFLGDLADVAVPGTYSLVIAAADTLFMLTTQDEQVRCFANVAARLEPGGAFVVEAFVPDRTRYSSGQDVVVRVVTADSLVLGAARRDSANQRIEAQQVLVSAEGIRLVPGVSRYAWPPRTRPDGQAGWPSPSPSPRWVAGRALHRIQPQPRVGLPAGIGIVRLPGVGNHHGVADHRLGGGEVPGPVDRSPPASGPRSTRRQYWPPAGRAGGICHSHAADAWEAPWPAVATKAAGRDWKGVWGPAVSRYAPVVLPYPLAALGLSQDHAPGRPQLEGFRQPMML